MAAPPLNTSGCGLWLPRTRDWTQILVVYESYAPRSSPCSYIIQTTSLIKNISDCVSPDCVKETVVDQSLLGS